MEGYFESGAYKRDMAKISDSSLDTVNESSPEQLEAMMKRLLKTMLSKLNDNSVDNITCAESMFKVYGLHCLIQRLPE